VSVIARCHEWNVPHCDSCHDDEDQFGFELLEYGVGDVTFSVCCEVARMLDFAD